MEENKNKEDGIQDETSSIPESITRKDKIKKIIKKGFSLFIIASIIFVTGLYVIPTFAAHW